MKSQKDFVTGLVAGASAAAIAMAMMSGNTYLPPISKRNVYVDSVAGSDANTGLSILSPKQTLAAALALMTDQASLHVKRASTFRGAGEKLVWTWNKARLIQYGSGVDFIIDGSSPQLGVAGNWSAVPAMTNVWRRYYSASSDYPTGKFPLHLRQSGATATLAVANQTLVLSAGQWHYAKVSNFVGSITNAKLTVTSMGNYTDGERFANGQILTGTGVIANTKIVSQDSGTTMGVGVYTIDTDHGATPITIGTSGTPASSSGVLEIYSASNPASAFSALDIGYQDVALISGNDCYFDGGSLQWGYGGVRMSGKRNVFFKTTAQLNENNGWTGWDGMDDCLLLYCNGQTNGLYPTQGAHGIKLGAAAVNSVFQHTCKRNMLVGGCWDGNGEDGWQVQVANDSLALTIFNVRAYNNGENSLDVKHGQVLVQFAELDQRGTNAHAEGMTVHESDPLVTIEDSIVWGHLSANGTSGSNCAIINRGRIVARRTTFVAQDGYCFQFGTGGGFGAIDVPGDISACLFIKTGTASTAHCMDINSGTGHLINQNTFIAGNFAMAGAATALSCLRVREDTTNSVHTSVAEMQNNVFYCPTTSTGRYCVEVTNANASITLHQNNHYAKGETTKVVQNQGVAVNLAGMAAYEATGTTGDPLFTNIAVGDYSLQNGSPALNTGAVLAAIATNRARELFATPRNKGAF